MACLHSTCVPPDWHQLGTIDQLHSSYIPSWHISHHSSSCYTFSPLPSSSPHLSRSAPRWHPCDRVFHSMSFNPAKIPKDLQTSSNHVSGLHRVSKTSVSFCCSSLSSCERPWCASINFQTDKNYHVTIILQSHESHAYEWSWIYMWV